MSKYIIEIPDKLYKTVKAYKVSGGSIASWRILEAVANGIPLSNEISQGWIPVKERLPVNTNPVNITWVNHQPESYYSEIKDKPFTATGCFCDGKWYWYSSTCQDYLIYYRDCPFNAIDEGIEVLAWMPLPKPYTKEDSDT